MNKKLFLIFITLIFLTASINLYSQTTPETKSSTTKAVVSEKKDVAIFGTSAEQYNIDPTYLIMMDTKIYNSVASLRRFNIVNLTGMDRTVGYRLPFRMIDEFVERIKTFKSQTVTDKVESDVQFGKLAIPAEEFEKVVNSFVVVIPYVKNYKIKKLLPWSEKTKKGLQWYKGHRISYVVALQFVDVKKAKTVELVRMSFEGQSKIKTLPHVLAFLPVQEKKSLRLAQMDAMSSFTGVIRVKIRQTNTFKLRTAVTKTMGGNFIELMLGRNMGISPGHEYEVVEKDTSGRRRQKGYVRIYDAGQNKSTAQVLWGRAATGDQLEEYALFGGNFSFNFGVGNWYRSEGFQRRIAGKRNPDGDSFYSPAIGMNFAVELGFAGRFLVDMTAFLNFSTINGYIIELGGAYRLYMGRLSFDVGLMPGLSFVYGKWNGDYYDPNTGLYYDGYDIEATGIGIGIKGFAAVNYQFNPHFILSFAAGYRLYSDINSINYSVQDTDTGYEYESELVDLADDEKTHFRGMFGALMLTFRF